MIRPPEKIPADPRPAMARPTIKATEFGATPQSSEPSSKMADGDEKNPFDGIEGVEFAKEQLKGA